MEVYREGIIAEITIAGPPYSMPEEISDQSLAEAMVENGYIKQKLGSTSEFRYLGVQNIEWYDWKWTKYKATLHVFEDTFFGQPIYSAYPPIQEDGMWYLTGKIEDGVLVDGIFRHSDGVIREGGSYVRYISLIEGIQAADTLVVVAESSGVEGNVPGDGEFLQRLPDGFTEVSDEPQEVGYSAEDPTTMQGETTQLFVIRGPRGSTIYAEEKPVKGTDGALYIKGKTYRNQISEGYFKRGQQYVSVHNGRPIISLVLTMTNINVATRKELVEVVRSLPNMWNASEKAVDRLVDEIIARQGTITSTKVLQDIKGIGPSRAEEISRKFSFGPEVRETPTFTPAPSPQPTASVEKEIKVVQQISLAKIAALFLGIGAIIGSFIFAIRKRLIIREKEKAGSVKVEPEIRKETHSLIKNWFNSHRKEIILGIVLMVAGIIYIMSDGGIG